MSMFSASVYERVCKEVKTLKIPCTLKTPWNHLEANAQYYYERGVEDAKQAIIDRYTGEE